MVNFNDEWNKLTPAQQEAVKKKAQEKVANGYDPNKIKSHIENNFTTTPKQTSSNTSTGTVNNNYGSTVLKQTNTGTNNNSTPSYISAKIDNTQLKQNNNTNQFGIPGVNMPNTTPNTPKQENTIKTPNINPGIQKQVIRQNPNPNDFGIDKNNRKFQMTAIQKDQKAYMEMIQKKRDTEGFPKNAARKGLISEYLMPNWKGGMIRMTEEENHNMPSEMTVKDKEYIKFMTNDKTRKEHGANFDNYWNNIKDVAYTLPKEVEGLTREKFNSLNDNDKLRLYNSFVQYERKQNETQEKKTKEVKAKDNYSLDELKQRKQKIENGVKNMTKEQYNNLTEEQKKQINETYANLEKEIAERKTRQREELTGKDKKFELVWNKLKETNGSLNDSQKEELKNNFMNLSEEDKMKFFEEIAKDKQQKRNNQRQENIKDIAETQGKAMSEQEKIEEERMLGKNNNGLKVAEEKSVSNEKPIFTASGKTDKLHTNNSSQTFSHSKSQVLTGPGLTTDDLERINQQNIDEYKREKAMEHIKDYFKQNKEAKNYLKNEYGYSNNNDYDSNGEVKEMSVTSTQFKDTFVTQWDKYSNLKSKLFNKDGTTKDGVTEEQIFDFINIREIVKNMHYDRNILNKEIPLSLKDMENAIANAEKWGEEPWIKSVLHGEGNIKYTHPNGGEVIYNQKTGEIVNQAKYMGTYNFFTPVITSPSTYGNHNKYDVKPYEEFGNSLEDDSNINDRIGWKVVGGKLIEIGIDKLIDKAY